jgi:hypothetical protein
MELLPVVLASLFGQLSLVVPVWAETARADKKAQRTEDDQGFEADQ